MNWAVIMDTIRFADKSIGIEGAALYLPPPARRALWNQLEKRNRRYPLRLIHVPAAEWPEMPEGVTVPDGCLRSREFLVVIYNEKDGIVRLSIKRTNFDPETGLWDDDISWDDLQLLKHEAGFSDRPAVEIYPPNRDIVNVASMRHIWILPEAPALMWKRG